MVIEAQKRFLGLIPLGWRRELAAGTTLTVRKGVLYNESPLADPPLYRIFERPYEERLEIVNDEELLFMAIEGGSYSSTWSTRVRGATINAKELSTQTRFPGVRDHITYR